MAKYHNEIDRHTWQSAYVSCILSSQLAQALRIDLFPLHGPPYFVFNIFRFTHRPELVNSSARFQSHI